MASAAVSSGRRAVLAVAASFAAASLEGCASWFHKPLEPVCPDSADVSYKDGLLTIDAHCHTFNGTDLQIADFLSKVAVKQTGALGAGANALGSILQELAWSFAPSGDQELAALRTVVEVCTRAGLPAQVAALRQQAYSVGRGQLQAALRRSAEFRPALERFSAGALPFELDETQRTNIDAVRIIETLPPDVESYRAPIRLESFSPLSAKSRSASGMIDFVLQNFQYRYVSIHDYLHTYNQPGRRVVDLMLPSMVDYDWWLSNGRATPTSLATQVEVAKQIAIVTGGRVHGFVPYDPLREIAHELGFAANDSISLVKAGVNDLGCAGVKLYPPMGFAPLGNEEAQRNHGANFWARSWLPDWMKRPDMGVLLDKAMMKVLAWCEANEVPVMAHTSLSNGVTEEFQALAGAHYWDIALQAYPKLRVNFGHFGDSAIVGDGLARARAFANLMSATGPSGTAAYADAGYFVEVIGSRPAMLDDLRTLYDETADKGNAALANRLLYGTDWEMTLTEGSVADYLSQFVDLFDELETRPVIRAQGLTGLSKKFFGSNAVTFLGLQKGGPTRIRLEKFYSANGVPEPDWKAKVDAI